MDKWSVDDTLTETNMWNTGVGLDEFWFGFRPPGRFYVKFWGVYIPFWRNLGHETHLLLFHCHEHVFDVTEAKLSCETLRHVHFQTQWCYTWSTTIPFQKISCFFRVFILCPRVFSPKAWAKQPKSDGQVYFPKYFDKNAKSLAMTSAEPRWAQHTLLVLPEMFRMLLTDIYIYTSQFFFGDEFFLDLTRDIFREICDMTSNLTSINLRNKKSEFISKVPYRSL